MRWPSCIAPNLRKVFGSIWVTVMFYNSLDQVEIVSLNLIPQLTSGKKITPESPPPFIDFLSFLFISHSSLFCFFAHNTSLSPPYFSTTPIPVALFSRDQAWRSNMKLKPSSPSSLLFFSQNPFFGWSGWKKMLQLLFNFQICQRRCWFIFCYGLTQTIGLSVLTLTFDRHH